MMNYGGGVVLRIENGAFRAQSAGSTSQGSKAGRRKRKEHLAEGALLNEQHQSRTTRSRHSQPQSSM